MKVTCNFIGRLGNNLLEIANTVILAKEQGLGLESVFFCRDFAASNGIAYTEDLKHKPRQFNYFYTNKDILLPIWDRFLGTEEYEAVLKTDEILVMNKGANRGIFLHKSWSGLLTELFYNEVTFVKYRSGHPYDFSRDIAIHVRRTDYTVWKEGSMLKSQADIQTTIDKFAKKTVVIFSDDIPWCKQSLAAPPHGQILFHNPTDQPACADLILMSCFKTVIPTTNSSYSIFAQQMSKDLQVTRRMIW